MNIALYIPNSLRNIVMNCRADWEGMQYKVMIAFFLMFLMNVDSVCDFVRRYPYSYSVSHLSRLIQKFPWNRFQRRLARSVWKKYGHKVGIEDLALVVDDTDNPKWANKGYAVGKWGSSKGVYSGQKIMVVALADIKRGITLPIAYKILPKRKDKTEPSALDHALSLLKAVKEKGFINLPVVADSWFDGVGFIEGVQNLGFQYFGQFKSSRKIKQESTQGKPVQSLRALFNQLDKNRAPSSWTQLLQVSATSFRWLSGLHIKIRNCEQSLKAVAAYNSKNSENAFGYYFTTDMNVSWARIWQLSRVRWGIECIFRSCKQSLGFGFLSCKGENAAHLAVVIPFFLHNEIKLGSFAELGIEEGSCVDLGASKLRSYMSEKALLGILAKPDSEVVECLKNRMSAVFASRKPRNKAVTQGA